MNTHARLSEITDLDLMGRLAADPGKTRYVREVERRIATVIETATKTLPDREAAFNEALFILTSPSVVAYYIGSFGLAPGATLAKLAWGVARRNAVREAGLAGDKQRRSDPLYGNRSRSVEAMLEEGFDLGGPTLDTRTLAQVEADRQERIRTIRTEFTSLANGTLTAAQIKVVLRYANLHADDALPEMAKQDAVAMSLGITQQGVAKHLAAARANAARYPVLTIAILELCGDQTTASKTVELLMAAV